MLALAGAALARTFRCPNCNDLNYNVWYEPTKTCGLCKTRLIRDASGMIKVYGQPALVPNTRQPEERIETLDDLISPDLQKFENDGTLPAMQVHTFSYNPPAVQTQARQSGWLRWFGSSGAAQTDQQPPQDNVKVFKAGEPCTICLDPVVEGNECVTKCGHQFHSTCIQRWAQGFSKMDVPCPNCRAPIDVNNGRHETAGATAPPQPQGWYSWPWT